MSECSSCAIRATLYPPPRFKANVYCGKMSCQIETQASGALPCCRIYSGTDMCVQANRCQVKFVEQGMDSSTYSYQIPKLEDAASRICAIRAA